MKQILKITASLLIATLLLLCAVSCTQKIDTAALWESATYQTDTTLGEGANTVQVQVTAGERSITLTLQTDQATLGEALYEQGLVNDPTFFDTCNGIYADWNRDGAYWSFYVDGAYASFGIGDAQAVTTGEQTYQIVYTKS